MSSDNKGIGYAVEQIIGLAGETRRTSILDAHAEKKGSYYLVGPDGKATLTLAGPGWHGETLDTPTQLRRFIIDRKATKGATFVGEDRIVFVFDLDDRRDAATCPLRPSPQYLWLKGESSKPLTQSDLVRLLRITLKGCVTADNLLPIVRQVKFDSSDGGVSTVEHGRQSMGRQVMAAVTGADIVPEETTLIVPVFENHGYAARIECAIEIDPATRTFKLTPYPLQVKAAMDGAMADLDELFSDVDELPPVYRGKP